MLGNTHGENKLGSVPGRDSRGEAHEAKLNPVHAASFLLGDDAGFVSLSPFYFVGAVDPVVFRSTASRE